MPFVIPARSAIVASKPVPPSRNGEGITTKPPAEDCFEKPEDVRAKPIVRLPGQMLHTPAETSQSSKRSREDEEAITETRPAKRLDTGVEKHILGPDQKRVREEDSSASEQGPYEACRHRQKQVRTVYGANLCNI